MIKKIVCIIFISMSVAQAADQLNQLQQRYKCTECQHKGLKGQLHKNDVIQAMRCAVASHDASEVAVLLDQHDAVNSHDEYSYIFLGAFQCNFVDCVDILYRKDPKFMHGIMSACIKYFEKPGREHWLTKFRSYNAHITPSALCDTPEEFAKKLRAYNASPDFEEKNEPLRDTLTLREDKAAKMWVDHKLVSIDERLAFIDACVKEGIDFNIGKNILAYAVNHNVNMRIIEKLFPLVHNKAAALMAAVGTNAAAIIRYFLSNNVRWPLPEDPCLYLAMDRPGALECIKVLKKYNFSETNLDKNEMSTIDKAALHENTEVLKYLLPAGTDVDEYLNDLKIENLELEIPEPTDVKKASKHPVHEQTQQKKRQMPAAAADDELKLPVIDTEHSDITWQQRTKKIRQLFMLTRDVRNWVLDPETVFAKFEASGKYQAHNKECVVLSHRAAALVQRAIIVEDERADNGDGSYDIVLYGEIRYPDGKTIEKGAFTYGIKNNIRQCYHRCFSNNVKYQRMQMNPQYVVRNAGNFRIKDGQKIWRDEDKHQLCIQSAEYPGYTFVLYDPIVQQ